MPKLALNMKSCEELQAALDSARAMLRAPALDPLTGLAPTHTPGTASLNEPEGPAGIWDEIREIEQAMREQGCPIS